MILVPYVRVNAIAGGFRIMASEATSAPASVFFVINHEICIASFAITILFLQFFGLRNQTRALLHCIWWRGCSDSVVALICWGYA